MKVEKIFPTNHVGPVKGGLDFGNIDGRIVKNRVSMSYLKTIIWKTFGYNFIFNYPINLTFGPIIEFSES